MDCTVCCGSVQCDNILESPVQNVCVRELSGSNQLSDRIYMGYDWTVLTECGPHGGTAPNDQ